MHCRYCDVNIEERNWRKHEDSKTHWKKRESYNMGRSKHSPNPSKGRLYPKYRNKR